MSENYKIRNQNYLVKSLLLVNKVPVLNTILQYFKNIIISTYYNASGVTYNMGNLITNKNCDFMKEPEFIESYNAGMKQYDSECNQWTLHIIQWAIFHAKKLQGDFVECGVNKGKSAMSTMTYIDFKSLKNKKYYLFDTFCGLDKEFSTKEEYDRHKNDYSDCYDYIKRTLGKYPNVVIVKGTVPKTLSQVDIQKVAYLHIDMNCALPEKEALKHFWSKLVSGAIVILDDYGGLKFFEQKKVADDFCASVGVKVLSLPIGQGLIIKP